MDNDKEERKLLRQLSMIENIRKEHEWAFVGHRDMEKVDRSESFMRKGEMTKQSKLKTNELGELLETAMYREVASQSFYLAGQQNTQDAGAAALMKELAEQESKHLSLLKSLTAKSEVLRKYHPGKIADLKISEYLTGGDSLEGAGLQDTLSIAIKREQQAMEFYSGMMGILRDKSAKNLCQRLAKAELGHKYKLEILYDDLFYSED